MGKPERFVRRFAEVGHDVMVPFCRRVEEAKQVLSTMAGNSLTRTSEPCPSS